MKINISIDCTPQEARQFLGLPDVAPMQERLMRQAEDRLSESIQSMDAGALAAQWMPATLKGLDQLQSVWTQMARAAMDPGPPGSKSKAD